MSGFDVVVVGAGIVGCACAMECARAGLRVAVVEAGEPGGGATGAGMGHVVAMDDSPAQLALTRYSQERWLAFRDELPGEVEFAQRGTIWVAADDEEMGEADAKRKRYAAAGIESEIVGAAALRGVEPHLREGLAGGLLVREDAVLFPPAAAAYFLGDAVRHGAVLLRGKAAVEVGRRSVLLADGTRLAAAFAVVATGTGDRLLGWLAVRKRKGHLAITVPSAGFVSHQLLELGYMRSAHAVEGDSVAFNVQPRRNGQVLIGASRQYGSEDPAIEESVLRSMLDRAYLYMPGLAELGLERVWTGFRAATPDKLPYIGAAEDPSVVYAVGFEGLGITSAPGAARLVVDAILGRVAEIDATPYLPARSYHIAVKEKER